jgi:aminoglycoside 2'-N-acetyltransferase I
MDETDLDLRVVESRDLPDDELEVIVDMCSRAFGQPYKPFMDTFVDATHVIGYLDGKIISHALWIERWLQIEDSPFLRTAYIEAVVTEEAYRNRGYASAVMRRLAEELDDFELAALATGFPEFYLHLGWQIWEGPLFIRTQEGMTSSPAEAVMVLELPNSPELDINSPLSAEWREGELW